MDAACKAVEWNTECSWKNPKEMNDMDDIGVDEIVVLK
jgi:hypothetical protein